MPPEQVAAEAAAAAAGSVSEAQRAQVAEAEALRETMKIDAERRMSASLAKEVRDSRVAAE